MAKNRARKKEEKEAKERRMEELRKENQEIEQRTAVHQQVSAIYHCSVIYTARFGFLMELFTR